MIADLEAGEPDAVLAEIAGQLGRFLIFAGRSTGRSRTWSAH